MPDPKTALLVLLGVFAAAYVAFWLVQARAALRREPRTGEFGSEVGFPGAYHLFVGFVTDFFDAVGVGSFATTTSLYKLRKIVPDRLIPGTLNVGHTLPTMLQAWIFTQIVEVEMTTLVSMIVAAVAGAWVGAPIVAGLPRRKVQIGMGFALAVAAAIFVYKATIGKPPAVGTIGLSGGMLWLGIAGNFLLGALMTLGIGLYAPCMLLVALLGMNPSVAFPIMMSSCAFLMPVASAQFIRKRSYSLRAALGLAIAGLPGSWIAAKFFEETVQKNLKYIWWLVIAVVAYTAFVMLRAAFKPSPEADAAVAAKAVPTPAETSR